MSDNPSSFDLNGTEAPPPSSNGPDNKSFILVVSILVGVFLIAALGMAAYVLGVVLPKNKAQSTQAAQINFANTATVSALTQAATLAVKSSTPVLPSSTATLVPTNTVTQKPSSTPVIAVATNTQAPLKESTVDPRTATVSALLTQAVLAQQTGTFGLTVTATSSLPKTGFAEDIGFPSLLGLALLLIVVIFVVRRLRASPTA
jgi:LPXTG-motif cell wall-anchored protein